MENRYLSRGKRIDNGEWAEGFYAVIGEKTVIIVKEPEKFYDVDGGKNSHGNKIVEVDPETVCKCIGRTDRDKKLIFEHDVIAYLDTYSTESGYAEADCVGEVVWDEETLSFQVTNRLSAESWEVIDGECKVIGNTIDNPELLEV